MTPYLLLKWVHVLSSVVPVGTGFGTAFYLVFANRSGNVQARGAALGSAGLPGVCRDAGGALPDDRQAQRRLR